MKDPSRGSVNVLIFFFWYERSKWCQKLLPLSKSVRNPFFHLYCHRLWRGRDGAAFKLIYLPTCSSAIFNPIYIKVYRAVFSPNLFWKGWNTLIESANSDDCHRCRVTTMKLFTLINISWALGLILLWALRFMAASEEGRKMAFYKNKCF